MSGKQLRYAGPVGSGGKQVGAHALTLLPPVGVERVVILKPLAQEALNHNGFGDHAGKTTGLPIERRSKLGQGIRRACGGVNPLNRVATTKFPR